MEHRLLQKQAERPRFHPEGKHWVVTRHSGWESVEIGWECKVHTMVVSMDSQPCSLPRAIIIRMGASLMFEGNVFCMLMSRLPITTPRIGHTSISIYYHIWYVVVPNAII